MDTGNAVGVAAPCHLGPDEAGHTYIASSTEGINLAVMSKACRDRLLPSACEATTDERQRPEEEPAGNSLGKGREDCMSLFPEVKLKWAGPAGDLAPKTDPSPTSAPW